MKITNIILLTLAILGMIAGGTYWSQDWGAGWEFFDGAVSVPATTTQHDPSVPLLGTTFVLRVGEIKQFKDLSVKLASIDGDSRCPQGVVCVWAGEVSLTLEVTVPPNTPNTITLKTNTVANAVKNYSFTVLNVEPQNMVGKDLAKKDYQVTFEVKPFR